MRLGVGLATVVVAVVLTLVLRPGPSEATGVVDGPVVAVSMPGYPMALVQGTLTLRGDCLMLGNAVVFWPAGTFEYWQAWVFIGVFVVGTMIPTIYLAVRFPDAYRRRTRSR